MTFKDKKITNNQRESKFHTPRKPIRIQLFREVLDHQLVENLKETLLG